MTTGVVYQPLNADMAGPQDAWSRDMHQLQNLGIDRLLIQWTRHDDSEFAVSQHTDDDHWLMQRLSYAKRSGLSLVIGLHADSRYFDFINQSFDEEYWRRYLTSNREWAEQLQGMLNDHDLAAEGYYLPGELNDQILAEANHVDHIIEGLKELQSSLEAPLYISTFYTGHLPIEDYIAAIESIQASGALVLHQDGAGSRALTKNQVDEVLSRLDCRIPVITELFVEQSDGQIRALSDQVVNAKLTQVDYCASRYLFSLRYLFRWHER